MERAQPRGNYRQTNNLRKQKNSSAHLPQWSSKPDKVFTRIELDTKFYEGQDVEGIHLMTDFDHVRELQVRLARFSKGPDDFFPVNWPVSLSTKYIKKLTPSQYVVAPKPNGPRFLLYVDSSGEMFLENMTQHIFCVDEDRAVKMNSFDGRPVIDTVLDGVFCKEKLNRDDKCTGGEESSEKLTFVIRDAIRCNGVDLTGMNIVERTGFVKKEIIEPRLEALKNIKGFDQNEAFTLDIVEYLEASEAESYLSAEFEERYIYPIRSFIFFPRTKGYVCKTNFDIFQWAENDDQKCSFRLRIKEQEEAELFIYGRDCAEEFYEKILLTDEIRNLDGCIIDCRYVDHRWVFVKQRFDRKIPNGHRALNGKLSALENPVSRELLVWHLGTLAFFLATMAK
ncbi:mRNA-capping enzyme-like [Daphnia carinata]|uniref:mRNA-capping enzyme-like n=1 Tax=Daphnia carinata TaxID=120202 RepID=UPI00257BA26E|nr:mRNA-capping enzyme-like [Daphnia carinata]